MTEICQLCGEPIIDGQKTNYHHPDRENDPETTVLVHQDCHVKYHKERGDFVRWGALARTAGTRGYRAALDRCPDFHRRGGVTRSHSAQRDANGRFVKAPLAYSVS